MTRDEAVTIVSMIVNSWPGQDWDAERLKAYAYHVEALDAEVTTRAVMRAVRELKYRPSINELLEFVRIERALAASDEARYVLPEMPVKPDWVFRWERARAAGDQRPFPEQMTAMDMLARQSPLHYAAYKPPDVPVTDREHWIQPDEYQPNPTL